MPADPSSPAQRLDEVQVHIDAGEFEAALALAQSLRAQFEAQGDAALQLNAEVYLVRSLVKLERFSAAIAHAEVLLTPLAAAAPSAERAELLVRMAYAQAQLSRYDDPGVVTVPRRMAPVWMLDGDGEVRPEFVEDYVVKGARRAPVDVGLVEQDRVSTRSPTLFRRCDRRRSSAQTDLADDLGDDSGAFVRRSREGHRREFGRDSRGLGADVGDAVD